LNLVTAGSYDDVNRIRFCNRVRFCFCARHNLLPSPSNRAHKTVSSQATSYALIKIALLLTTSDSGFKP
jgi:hypothetical protein